MNKKKSKREYSLQVEDEAIVKKQTIEKGERDGNLGSKSHNPCNKSYWRELFRSKSFGKWKTSLLFQLIKDFLFPLKCSPGKFIPLTCNIFTLTTDVNPFPKCLVAVFLLIMKAPLWKI